MRRLSVACALGIVFMLPGLAMAAGLQWDALPPLPNPDGVAGPFVGVHGNALIVAGGANFPKPVWETTKVFHDTIHVMVRETKNGKPEYRWISGLKLERPIAYGASASIPEGVVCIGGNDERNTFADVFLLQWNPKSETVERLPLPSLPESCTNASAALTGRKIFVAGGTTGLGLETAQSNFWSLDLSRMAEGGLAWEKLPPWPGPSRALAIAAAQNDGVNDCIYIFSGRRVNEEGKTEFLTDAYEFNPAKGNSWRRRAGMPRCMMAGTGIALGQSHIFLLSGADGSLFHETDNLKDAHPGFAKESFAYHTITDTWTTAGVTPANQVTTTAVRWGNDTVNDPIIIASGEVRPRVRTPNIWAVRPLVGFGTP